MIKEDKEERKSLERGKKKHQRSKKNDTTSWLELEKIKRRSERMKNEEEAGKKALVLSQRGESSIRFCGKCTYI